MELLPLDPQWRCFFQDGSRLDLVADVEQMAGRLEDFAPGQRLGDGYRKFIDLSCRLSDISEKYFFWKPVGSLRDTFSVTGTFSLGVLSDILSMRMGRTVSSVVHKHLREPRPAQMAEHFTQYVGSSPLQSPAILCSIAHMQTEQGIWYPRGGTRAVPVALEKLAEELGVGIHRDTPVSRLTVVDGAVTGIETESGESRRYDAVVSNMDVVRTHRELLGGGAAKDFESRRGYEPACSGVVLYLGLDRRYDHLLHHNFVFSRDPVEEFRAIYREGRPAPDPTCYVCAPAQTEAEVAPDGGEALYVLVHTPYLRAGHDWKTMLPEYREAIVRKLETTGDMPDIRERITFESALTPLDIKERYFTLDGAIYGLASHGRFRGAFKPSNRSPDLRGLYLAGGSAHPGPGMPMALMSGWIAADALDRDGLTPQ
jgi:phytoene desaturase